jgi:hypothetical protein
VGTAAVKRVSGRKLLAASVVGAVVPCAPSRPFTRPRLLHQATVVAESVPTGYCMSNATYRAPPVYVNGEPPENGMSNGPAGLGSVVVALWTTVMPVMAVAHVVLFRFVASDVFCR